MTSFISSEKDYLTENDLPDNIALANHSLVLLLGPIISSHNHICLTSMLPIKESRLMKRKKYNILLSYHFKYSVKFKCNCFTCPNFCMRSADCTSWYPHKRCSGSDVGDV